MKDYQLLQLQITNEGLPTVYCMHSEWTNYIIVLCSIHSMCVQISVNVFCFTTSVADL